MVWIFALDSGIESIMMRRSRDGNSNVSVATSTYTWVVQEVESRGMLDPSP